jgi:hypothetical protein
MKLEMLLLTCIKQLMRLCNVIDIPDFKRFKGRHGRDRMVVGLTTTYAMSCEFESYSWRGVPPPIKPTAPI